MCVPCKIIINQAMAGVIRGVEKVLTDRNIHEDKIPYNVRMGLIDKLREVDLAAFSGGAMPTGGVKGIIAEIEKYFPPVKDVWKMLNPD